MSAREKSNGNCATRIGFLASWQRPKCVGLLVIRGCESCGCAGAQRGALSPEPPGIFRFAIKPAGGRPGQQRLPKPAVFESIAALGLLPSRALSSGWTPRILPPHGFWASPRCSAPLLPRMAGECIPQTMRTLDIPPPLLTCDKRTSLITSKITHSFGRRSPFYSVSLAVPKPITDNRPLGPFSFQVSSLKYVFLNFCF